MEYWRDIPAEGQSYFDLATSLRKRGFRFAQAYELLFGRLPRVEHLTPEDLEHIEYLKV